MKSIALVGSGPMGVYLLQHLVTSETPLDIVIYEAGPLAGVGMPYDATFNADYMLCNAFSREIPPIRQTLLEWLKARPAYQLSQWELSTHDLSARSFYPRVLIGDYMHEQFNELCDSAGRNGHKIDIRTHSLVSDIQIDAEGRARIILDGIGKGDPQSFDAIAITTGHHWPENPVIDDVSLLSPWPYTKLITAPYRRFGVLGSSLSAIDVVVALGHAHGKFDEIGNKVRWYPNNEDAQITITMVSHHGIMPEGDFYYPYPYEPLAHITDAAVDRECEVGLDGLLERVFALLCDELNGADPGYLAQFPASAATVEGFAAAYFSHRKNLGGLRAVRDDLDRARQSQQERETIPHRYALLRGHAQFDRILRKLSAQDYQRFIDLLMPVFADCYAAVPHLSLARIAALYDAGVLELSATTETAAFSYSEDGLIEVDTEDGTARFEVLIDSRGQSAEPLAELPFPGVVSELDDASETLLSPFKLHMKGNVISQIYCLSLPQILVRYPFSQGLIECNDHAKAVAAEILADVADE